MERWQTSPGGAFHATASRTWRYAWLLWILMGAGLLAVDMWDSVALVRSIAGALQNRPVRSTDTFLAMLAALAMTSSQCWLFAHLGSESAAVMGTRRAFWITLFLVIPGIMLNVAANFFVFVGGHPSPTLLEDLQASLSRGTEQGIGRIFLVFAAMLALIVSFFPEFLVERGWRELTHRPMNSGSRPHE